MRYGTVKQLVKLSAAPVQGATQSDQKEDKPFLGRLSQGLAGTGVATANLRTAKTLASPNDVLYHGTRPASAASILGAGPNPDVTGLDVRFSGYADRLNAQMLANAVNTQLMDAGLNPTSELLEELTDAARDEMAAARMRGIQNFDSVAAIEKGVSRVLAEKGFPSDQIQNLLEKARPNLQESGKRIYLAQTPAVTAMYGTDLTEGNVIQRKFRELQTNPVSATGKQISGILNVLTGGVVPEIKQSLDKFKYNSQIKGLTSQAGSTDDIKGLMAAIRDKDYGTIESELKRLNPNITPEQIENILGKVGNDGLGVTFGVRAKRDNLKSLSDFPFVSQIFSLNPGLKHEASSFVPTFDPINDLSVPESIGLSDFRSVDLIDNERGTPLLRYNLPNKSSAVTLGERMRGLRKASPYAVLGALGADLAQDAVFQKGLLTKRGLNAGVQKLKSMYRQPQEKQAAIRNSTRQGLQEAAKALKFIAAPTAAVGATSIGASYGYGKASDFIEKQLSTPEMIAFKEQEKQRLIAAGKDPRTAEGLAGVAARNAVLQVVSFPAGVAGGAISAAIANPKRALRFAQGNATAKDFSGAIATGGLGYLLTPTAMAQAEQIRMGKDISDSSPMAIPLRGTKVEKEVRERPYLAGLIDYPGMVALPLAGAYAGRKFYSGDYAKLLRQIKSGPYSDTPVSSLTDFIGRAADKG